MKSKTEGNSHQILKAKRFTEKGFESERGLQSPSITQGSHGCQGNSSRESSSDALTALALLMWPRGELDQLAIPAET